MKTFTSLFLLYGMISMLVTATPSKPPSNTNPLDRYIPGDILTVVHSLDVDSGGFLSVGRDGVLRSFGAKGNVIDFHQLDPDQVASFAKTQAAAWERVLSDNTIDIDLDSIPGSVAELAEADAVDGRKVLDENALLHPETAVRLDRRGRQGEPRESREVLDELRLERKQFECNNHNICENGDDCLPTCPFGCFHPGPGEAGICF